METKLKIDSPTTEQCDHKNDMIPVNRPLPCSIKPEKMDARMQKSFKNLNNTKLQQFTCSLNAAVITCHTKQLQLDRLLRGGITTMVLRSFLPGLVDILVVEAQGMLRVEALRALRTLERLDLRLLDNLQAHMTP